MEKTEQKVRCPQPSCTKKDDKEFIDANGMCASCENVYSEQYQYEGKHEVC
jgi:hypothetical protein